MQRKIYNKGSRVLVYYCWNLLAEKFFIEEKENNLEFSTSQNAFKVILVRAFALKRAQEWGGALSKFHLTSFNQIFVTSN